jgi:hypothetical protein
LNSPITPKEIEAVIKCFPTEKKKKKPWAREFSAGFYQTFIEELMETLPNSFDEAIVLTKKISDQFPFQILTQKNTQ